MVYFKEVYLIFFVKYVYYIIILFWCFCFSFFIKLFIKFFIFIIIYLFPLRQRFIFSFLIMIDDFMQGDEIRNILMKSLLLDDAYVYITGNHYHVVVISDKFEGMTKVNKHKLVFNPLMKYITANKIHSLTINAYTLDEWKQNTKLDNH